MAEMQSPRIAGRKRGRPPLHSAPMKMAVHNLYSSSACSLPVVKIPKKRGRKPGHKLKSRVLMTPLAISPPRPPRSTPEPDVSSIPQDAAAMPSSAAAAQALTGPFLGGYHPPEVTPQFHRRPRRAICIYVNKQANLGPYLERKKVQQLPEHFGPERPTAVLQQVVQACIDCAYQQKTVFSLVKQGYGGEMVSAKTVISEDYLLDPVGMKRYSVDPSNSAFSCMGSSSSSSLYSGRLSSGDGCLGRGLPTSSCGHRSGPMSSSGPSTVGLRHQASSLMRNGTYLEGNKSASSPSPDGQDAARPASKNPSTWTVEDVVWFVKDADPQALGPHVELFRKHEIDGNALLLLKSDMIMKYLGLKLGPALKLCYHIDKLKQSKF
ncbi:sex comb on midleg-like protein 4 isoform X1 [Antechinus flavipes]|uniref:sex comb on midleg-like protein 4 isoform X1 n=1 Tax=Antechinus flavipes TaxID=38775 RepID=UPI0022359E7B|nr:sex comb on midleg-like protein 4 isoform X1 [Antechinus flavipes]